MIVDRTHARWAVATTVIFLALAASYAQYVRAAPGGPTGGSVPGLLYGIAGSLLMLVAGLLGARKKLPKWRIGSAQAWVRGHIWLGLLSVPLILFHAGFHWGGLLEQLLLGGFAVVVASGIFGLALQQFLPRQITANVPLETFYDQLPQICGLLQLEADVLVAKLCGPLPLAPGDGPAFKSRLEQLGVTGKDPVSSVYAPAFPTGSSAAVKDVDAQNPISAEPSPQTNMLVAAIPSSDPVKPIAASSAAEKIAMVRAAKAAAPPRAPTESTKDSAEPAAKPAQSGSAADKIASIRAAKKFTPPATSASPEKNTPPQPAAADSKTLSAAEKIALVRAAKLATAEAKPPEANNDAVPPSAPVKKVMTPAEKIAAIKAAKAVAPPDTSMASPPAVSASDAAAPASQASTAAAKIAALRAAKKPPLSSGLVGVDTGEQPIAKPLTALEKIAAAKAKLLAQPKTELVPPTASKSPAAPAMALKSPRPGLPAASEEWKQVSPELRQFYLGQVRPFLGPEYRGRDPLASRPIAEGIFAMVRSTLPAELVHSLGRLAELCEERRQLALQASLHRWLHGWLLVHIPASVALLVLGIVHAVVSLYY